MKKFCLITLMVVAMASTQTFADGYISKGSLSALAGIGYNGFVGFYGGAEYGIMPLAASPQITVDLSTRALGSYWGKSTTSSFGSTSSSYIGVGAYAVGHLGWKQFKLKNEFLDKIDTWIGLGLGVSMASTNTTVGSYSSSVNTTDFGFAYCGGSAYWFSKDLAVSYDYNGQVGSAIGVIYKF